MPQYDIVVARAPAKRSKSQCWLAIRGTVAETPERFVPVALARLRRIVLFLSSHHNLWRFPYSSIHTWSLHPHPHPHYILHTAVFSNGELRSLVVDISHLTHNVPPISTQGKAGDQFSRFTFLLHHPSRSPCTKRAREYPMSLSRSLAIPSYECCTLPSALLPASPYRCFSSPYR